MTAINIFIILFGIKQFIIIMEEDILNYLPTVMFRGTPCIININFILINSLNINFRKNHKNTFIIKLKMRENFNNILLLTALMVNTW